MNLVITVHRDELAKAIHDFLPMRLTLGDQEGDDPTWFEIEAVETMTFLPGHGLGLTCRAQVHYPIPVLPSTFTVNHLSLEVVPAIDPSPEGAVLAFRVSVAAIDVAYLPGFVDRMVAGEINDALTRNAATIAWNFTRALTRRIQLPARLTRVRSVDMAAQRGDVGVTGDSLVLTLVADFAFHHDP